MTDRVVLPSSVTPVHYDLEIEPDFGLLKFQGILDISVNVNGMN
jgi:aminopeptidase 2